MNLLNNIKGFVSTPHNHSIIEQYDRDVIKVGNLINGSLHNEIDFPLPRIIVIGTQSSGKSSLLNSIIGFDILPIGKNMVTKSPFSIELINDNNQSVFQIGTYNEGRFTVTKSIQITEYPISKETSNQIEREINLIYKARGIDKNISTEPIYARIYSQHVPYLSLIDLPGLISVPRTDEGQPADLKQKIIDLIDSYAQNEKTVILGVIASREDIEADMAMEIIKKNDPNGMRTVGVLTKVDLMNNDNDISHYIKGNISRDLKLKYGYFAIRNRSDHNMSVSEGYTQEYNYFYNHPVYSGIRNLNRFGIGNLTTKLSSVLTTQIKDSFPQILNYLNTELSSIHNELEQYSDYYSNPNILLNQFAKEFENALFKRCSNYNIAAKIAQSLSDYREHIRTIDIFSNDNYNDEKIMDLIQYSEGIHMSFKYPSMEIFENCLQNQRDNPFDLLYPHGENTLETIETLMNELNDLILDLPMFRFYKIFISEIKTYISKNIIHKNIEKTKFQMKEFIKCEKRYIWTDNSDFHKIIQNYDGKGNICHLFRQLLQSYFRIVGENMANNIPKLCMLYFIHACNNDIKTDLYDYILNIDSNTLMNETEENKSKKMELEERKKTIVSVKNAIENCSKI